MTATGGRDLHLSDRGRMSAVDYDPRRLRAKDAVANLAHKRAVERHCRFADAPIDPIQIDDDTVGIRQSEHPEFDRLAEAEHEPRCRVPLIDSSVAQQGPRLRHRVRQNGCRQAYKHYESDKVPQSGSDAIHHVFRGFQMLP